MKKFIRDLLSETGSISTVRLMAILSMLTGAGIGCYGIYAGRDLSGVAQVCGVFVGSAFAAKVGQKFVENKDNQ